MLTVALSSRAHANNVELSAHDTAEITYDSYERYKLSQSNDYSPILDKRTVLDLARAHPDWDRTELLTELQQSQAERRKLISDQFGYTVPDSLKTLGDTAVGLSAVAAGVLGTPAAGGLVAVGGKAALNLGVSRYENWASKETRLEAAQGLYDAEREGQTFMSEVDSEARSLHESNTEAAYVLDIIDHRAMGIDMDTSPSEILHRDPQFASFQTIRSIYDAVSPDGSLSLDVSRLRRDGDFSLAQIGQLVEQAKTASQSDRDHQRREDAFSAAESANYLIGRILSLDPHTADFGKGLVAFGNAGIGMARAIDKYQMTEVRGGSYGSLVFTADIVSICFSLAQAFQDDGPTPDQIIIGQLNKIQNFLLAFSMEVSARFDRVDFELKNIWRDMLDEFRRTQYDTANVREALVTLSDRVDSLDHRVGRVQENLLTAIRNTTTYDLVSRVDRIAKASRRTTSYRDFERAAISVDTFASNAIYQLPFVYVQPISGLTHDEQLSALQDDSIVGTTPAAPESITTDRSPSIDLVDQIARQSNAVRIPPIPSPSAWLFAALQFQRLVNSQPPAFRTRLPPNVVDDIAAPGKRILDFYDSDFGITVADSRRGRSVIEGLLNSYGASVQVLVHSIEEAQQSFADAHVQSVKFWSSVDDAVAQEGSRPYFDIASDPIHICPGLDGNGWAGTFPNWDMPVPQEAYNFIDPTFRLAARLKVIGISFCHYSSDDAYWSKLFQYRIAAHAEGVSVMNRVLPASDEGPGSGRTIDYRTQWAQKYEARFGSAVEDYWDSFRLSWKGRYADPGTDFNRWLYYCMQLTTRPPADSTLGKNCAVWQASRKAPIFIPPTENGVGEVLSSQYERNEYLAAVKQRIIPVLLDARRSFEADLLTQMRSETLSQAMSEVTYRKRIIEAVLSTAYARTMYRDDAVRGIFRGANGLMDASQIVDYLASDSSNGSRYLLLGDELSHRVSIARSALQRLGPAEPPNQLLITLDSLERLQEEGHAGTSPWTTVIWMIVLLSLLGSPFALRRWL